MAKNDEKLETTEVVEPVTPVDAPAPTDVELAEQERVAEKLEKGEGELPVKGSTKGVLKGADAEAAKAADEARAHPETIVVDAPETPAENPPVDDEGK